MGSPTTRTLKRLRDEGFTACVVEKFNSFTKRRIDAFGFGDILACHPSFGVVLVQATSGDNHAARRTKIDADPKVAPLALAWLRSGGLIYVESWRKGGAAGKRKSWVGRRDIAVEADGRIGRIGRIEWIEA